LIALLRLSFTLFPDKTLTILIHEVMSLAVISGVEGVIR
jgi:hypothetical protein